MIIKVKKRIQKKKLEVYKGPLQGVVNKHVRAREKGKKMGQK